LEVMKHVHSNIQILGFPISLWVIFSH